MPFYFSICIIVLLVAALVLNTKQKNHSSINEMLKNTSKAFKILIYYIIMIYIVLLKAFKSFKKNYTLCPRSLVEFPQYTRRRLAKLLFDHN